MGTMAAERDVGRVTREDYRGGIHAAQAGIANGRCSGGIEQLVEHHRGSVQRFRELTRRLHQKLCELAGEGPFPGEGSPGPGKEVEAHQATLKQLDRTHGEFAQEVERLEELVKRAEGL